MATLEQAIALAALAHKGQRDDLGRPYILHPLRVMQAVDGSAAQMVAVLHDVLEESALQAEDLLNHGFSVEIVAAVVALTRPASESRIAAAQRIMGNALATQVKIADLADNLAMTRALAQPTAEDHARVAEYLLVQQMLGVTPYTPDAEALASFKPGLYQHYKGNFYLALGLARDDKSEETVVVYSRLYPRSGLPLSTRTLSAWQQLLALTPGQAAVPRFTYRGQYQP